MSNPKYTYLIVMVFFMIKLASAQNIAFEHYNDYDGLSHNSVRYIVQDENGFLWLGTFAGLNRFDGYEFNIYSSNAKQPHKLANDEVTALALDNQASVLWIGTRNGLIRFELKTHTFTSFLPEKDNIYSLPDHEIRSLYLDNFNRIWVGTKNEGVYHMDKKSGRFTKVDITGTSYVRSIVGDSTGAIWIGSYLESGITKVDLNNNGTIKSTKQYTLNIPDSDEKNPYVNFIYEDHKSDIFIGTRQGLYKLDKESDKFENLYIKNESRREKLGPYFLSVARSPEGQYWVGTLGGLLVCDSLEEIEKGNYQWHFPVLSNNLSLVDNLVYALYFDKSGVLWIGTEDGLDKYNPYDNQFRLNKDISRSLDNQVPWIRGFSKTIDDKVVVATRYNGLFIQEGENFSPFFNQQRYDIASIYSNDGINFYCGLWNGRLLIYNDQTKRSQVVDIGFNNRPVLAFESIDDHTLIVGSFGEGAVYFDKNTRESTPLAGNVLKGVEVNQIAVDVFKNVWFATENGVLRLNTKTNVLKTYASSKNSGIPNEHVSGILIDQKQNIWATTRKGLAIYNEEIDDFNAVDGLGELEGSWITDIVNVDDNLWLNLNNNGLARFNPERGELDVYRVKSGNRLDVFSSSGFFKFNDSRIYVAGKKGVIYFSPDRIKTNKWTPSPVITEFKVQSKEVLPGDIINGQTILNKDINYSKEATLTYDDRNFSIEFSSPSFTDAKLNKFEYMLEGFDDKWTQTNSNSRTVQYTNLPFGEYLFKIKAANSSGVWSNEEVYRIEVLPPFWLTYKMIFLILFVTSVIFYFVRREIKNRLKLKRELLVEKVERERDEKLNKEKIRFFTNLSHELRTPLTLILGSAKQLLIENQDQYSEQQTKKFGLIHQNANRLLLLVNQILDFRKAEKGKLELKVSKTDIRKHTLKTFNSFNELAEDKGVQLHFNCEHEKITGWLDRDKYDKILYNLLSNAVKFTPKYGNVDVFLGCSNSQNDRLIVEVGDDGIGIPEHSQKKIFSRFYQASNSKENNTGSGIGLAMVKSLVKLHKGNIVVNSEPKKGSVFTIEIPIDRAMFDKKEIVEVSGDFYETEDSYKPKPSKARGSITIKDKILLVEDNTDLRNYLVNFLSDYYKVYQAENGEKGLQLCKQIKPVLCVTDVMMPEMNGYKFCETLKKSEAISHIPVILLTALSESDDKMKGYDAGADAYLSKPLDPYLLKTRIENIIKTRSELKAKFSHEIEGEVYDLAHSPVDAELIRKLSGFIEKNMNNPELSTALICKETGMSSSKLYRKLKELTDLAPNEYIRTIRLKKSAQLLKTRKYNVSEVTFMVGFNDPLYFSRCFKKQFGFPPSNLL
ncbi:ATP-binding protein [Galbibacter sp. EGI 63066]|uniref:two-component regulator propeller domain-containing protein n=1 Tax=Galbibacter sp. EGI 63066 TaxID=2993559 RepID=UPI00224940C5|nr:two-component regulator propeller domain-containing protein [Galbibacter sp. EGI 63066]MCX2678644.1 ATP-binding protein [Galbibacter sp. EGI 63066]